MKYVILILSLLVVPSVLAKDVKCIHEGVKSTIILKEHVLIDPMENIVSTEVSPGVYEYSDSFGKVKYTINKNKIIMSFDNVTKVYTCDL